MHLMVNLTLLTFEVLTIKISCLIQISETILYLTQKTKT
jgi:hypothetical protein